MPTTDLVGLRRGSRAPEPPPPSPGEPSRRRKASAGSSPVPPPREGRDRSAPYRSPSASPFDPVTPQEPVAPLATDSNNGDHRAADEVYSFLSSFTAGVQRGLDEAQKDAGPGEDDTDR